MVRDQLVERARDFDIILEDVAITDLSFSPQYTNAIEAKQIGEAIDHCSSTQVFLLKTNISLSTFHNKC